MHVHLCIQPILEMSRNLFSQQMYVGEYIRSSERKNEKHNEIVDGKIRFREK